MMEAIAIRRLAGVSLQELTAAFNQAFSDYLVRVQLTEEQMQMKMQQEHVDLHWSVGAFADGRLVGLILHGYGIMQEAGCLYNAGTGVTPAYRGRQLTASMYRWLLPKAKVAGIRRVVLEAITANEKAIQVYQKIGFRRSRLFNLWKGNIPGSFCKQPLRFIANSSIAWQQVQSWWNAMPCWSAAPASIDASANHVLILQAVLNGQFVGYCCALRHNGRVLQLAVDPAFRNKGIGTAILAEAFRMLGKKEMMVLNADNADKLTNRFFEELHWQKSLQQYEMELTLQP